MVREMYAGEGVGAKVSVAAGYCTKVSHNPQARGNGTRAHGEMNGIPLA